ncbi:hypothetical protein ETQ85_24365 [Zoogloea oleivorans]|uniref:Uncharacterized protein n=1 Tax=Zoogloea oleivorans TaxID=1552750 RepID=A0A6C2CDC1_9RHOO|nr:hypothetical protein [Zoogloea oleivorans]TYC51423.1 hypothetical protein ETQ85_24365 [Zoogloea oleivorans]
MNTTYVISAEEKALLDTAKRVACVWGQKDGRLITDKKGREEAEAALVEQIKCGRVVVNDQFVCDIQN